MRGFLGFEYKGERCGNGAYAHGAVFAFYPNKRITTGDLEKARLCRSLANQSRGEAGV